MSKHILFISVPLRGHFNQILVLANQLLKHNYKISFMATEEEIKWISNNNIKIIKWEYFPDQKKCLSKENFWAEISQISNKWKADKLIINRAIAYYSSMYESIYKTVVQEKPDLIIADRAVIAAMDIARKYGIPLVIQTRYLGNLVEGFPGHPYFNSSFPLQMNFIQKFLNWIEPKLKSVYLLPSYLKLNRVRLQNTLSENLPAPWVGHRILVGSLFGIEIERPLPEHVKLVGPILKSDSCLPQDIQKWLEVQSSKKIIYVSFGTLVRLDKYQINKLIKAFSLSNVRVIWSLPKLYHHMLPSFSKDFLIKEYMPQVAILKHEYVKVFVSHCGRNSINESLYFGKPILGIPFFGDQFYNSARLLDLSVALILNKHRFSVSECSRKLNDLLNKKIYFDNTQSYSIKLKNSNNLKTSIDFIKVLLEG